jgi:transposase
LIGLSLDHIDHLEAAMARLDDQIDTLFATNTDEGGIPFEQARDHLDTIPGVAKRAAEAIIAEIGVDMSRFPTAGHLASWAGMAPGNRSTIPVTSSLGRWGVAARNEVSSRPTAAGAPRRAR